MNTIIKIVLLFVYCPFRDIAQSHILYIEALEYFVLKFSYPSTHL
jgi:hypothetical protein